MNRFPLTLLAIVCAVLVWSGIKPFDLLTWCLEVLPALVGLAIIIPAWRRFPLTPLLCTLIALHIIILAIGGHYTYALVPAGDWVRDWLGLGRNHYDRLGHLAQGFVPAIIARELFIRLGVVAKHGWRNYLIVSACLAVSALYELIEWATALVLGESSDSFLGTQGDVWDTQSDMFLCLIGAVSALVLLHQRHDRQLRRIAQAAGEVAA